MINTSTSGCKPHQQFDGDIVDPRVWSLINHFGASSSSQTVQEYEDSNPDLYAKGWNQGPEWLQIKREPIETKIEAEDERYLLRPYHPVSSPSPQPIPSIDVPELLDFEQSPPISKRRKRKSCKSSKEKKKLIEKRKSKYRGVSWSKPSQKWTAQVSHGGSKYYAGLYASDLDAAHAVNRECDRLMITRRNPGIGDPPPDLKKKQVRKKAARVSRYLGVSWCKNANKWQARVWHKGKYHWAGYYDTDKEAANAMYNTCKSLKIPRVKQDLIRMPELRILQSKKWLVSTDAQTFTLNEKGEFDGKDGILRGRLSDFTEPKGTLHAKFTWGDKEGSIYFIRLERDGFDGIYESSCGQYGRWIGIPLREKGKPNLKKRHYVPPQNMIHNQQAYEDCLVEKPGKRRRREIANYARRRIDDFSIPPPPRSPSLSPEPNTNACNIPSLCFPTRNEELKKEMFWNSVSVPDLPPTIGIQRDTLTRMERQQVRAKKLEPICSTIGQEGKAVTLFCNHCEEKFTAKPTFRAKYGHYLVNHRCVGMEHRQQYVVGMKRRSCELNCSINGCISLRM